MSYIKCAPLVSIAIPTFNRLDLLRRTIDSVLEQTYENIEIIISDNASNDGTKEFINSIVDSRLVLIHNTINLGMAGNWDACLNKARGEYFLLMSDDDALISNDAVSKLVDGFSSVGGDVNIGFTFSDVVLENVSGGSNKTTNYIGGVCRTEEIISDFFEKKLSLFPCCMLIKTNDLKDIGGYSKFGAMLAVDVCVWLSLSFKYRIAYHIPEPLALYRIHNSLSSSSVDAWEYEYNIIIKILKGSEKLFSKLVYTKLILAATSALTRIPIGYIYRSQRDSSNYNVKSILVDIYRFRRTIFCWNNINYFIKKYLNIL